MGSKLFLIRFRDRTQFPVPTLRVSSRKHAPGGRHASRLDTGGPGHGPSRSEAGRAGRCNPLADHGRDAAHHRGSVPGPAGRRRRPGRHDLLPLVPQGSGRGPPPHARAPGHVRPGPHPAPRRRRDAGGPRRHQPPLDDPCDRRG